MDTMLHGAALADKYVSEHPGTTMTRNAIKVMLRGGCIPSVTAGNRRFYSYERFTQFLEQGNENEFARKFAPLDRIRSIV